MGYLIIDGHCDSILDAVTGHRSLTEESTDGHLDFPRLKKAGISVQFFAAYIGSDFKPERSLKRALQLIDTFYYEIEKSQGQVSLVTNYQEIVSTTSQGHIGALLAIEGGEAIAEDLGVLRMLYRLGVRSIGLTWNQRNAIADGVGERASGGGLTVFGKAVIQEMNNLGILIDVSHISERGFWDVLATSSKPIVATHSNSMSVCNHPRNLNDKQIKALAKSGGVMGMNFAPDFICPMSPSLNRLVDHIDYIADLVGIEVIGLGSDFDGIEETPEGLENVTKLPRIFEELSNRGYKDEQIRKIAGENFLRVIKEVLK